MVRSANTLSVEDDNRGWEALITLFARALADTRGRMCYVHNSLIVYSLFLIKNFYF